MSLLLKALKQAEATNPGRLGGDQSDPESRINEDLELEPIPAGNSKSREWVEPPGLLFGGNSESTAAAPQAPRLRLPHLSLVPLTALLAVVVALGYGVYLYFALQPPTAVPPPTAHPVAAAPAASISRSPAWRATITAPVTSC